MCGWTWWPRLRSPPDAANGQEKKGENEGRKERERERVETEGRISKIRGGSFTEYLANFN